MDNFFLNWFISFFPQKPIHFNSWRELFTLVVVQLRRFMISYLISDCNSTWFVMLCHLNALYAHFPTRLLSAIASWQFIEIALIKDLQLCHFPVEIIWLWRCYCTVVSAFIYVCSHFLQWTQLQKHIFQFDFPKQCLASLFSVFFFLCWRPLCNDKSWCHLKALRYLYFSAHIYGKRISERRQVLPGSLSCCFHEEQERRKPAGNQATDCERRVCC